MRVLQHPAIVLLLMLVMAGCGLSPPYSERAYGDAVRAKVVGRDLVMQSVEEYSTHEREVAEYQKFLVECYEYARGKGPRNRNARHQWAIVLTADGGSIGEFLLLWKKKQRIDEFTRVEFEEILEDQFDQLIELERHRKIL